MFYNQKTVHFNYNYQNISAIHFCGLYNCFCLLHILSKCTTFALEIIFTAEITSYKLYDHGKELDPTKHQVNIKTETKNGMTYTAVELDGKKFGAEIITDSNGKTKASFYDQNGIQLKGSNISKNYKDGDFTNPYNQEYAKLTSNTTDRQALKQELKQQLGHIPTTSLHLKQSKQFDEALERHKTPLDKQKTSLAQSANKTPTQLQQIELSR